MDEEIKYGSSSTSSIKVEASDATSSCDHMMPCDVCLLDGETKPAGGFCEHCNDYLCSECKRYHRKNRLCRNHNVLDSDEMPAKKKQRKLQDPFELMERCQQHGTELSFICVNEDILCCEICKITYHKRCENVYSITDFLNEERDSEDFKNTMKELENTNQRFADLRGKCEAKKDVAESMFSETMSAVSEILSSVKNTDLLRVSSVSKTCESAVKDSLSLYEYMTSVQEEKNSPRKFIAQKNVNKQLKKLRESLDAVEEEGRNFASYKFVPNNIKAGSVAVNKNLLLGKLLLNSGSVPYNDICVKSPTDTYDCIVKDLCLLSSSVLFVVDFANKKVKLVDIKTGILTFELQLLQNPIHVTRLQGVSLAVTQSGRKIQIMTALLQENIIRTDSSILIDGNCKGITYLPHTDFLAVSLLHPHKLQIIDLHGHVIKTVLEDTDRDNIPLHAYTIRELNGKLFVLDRSKFKAWRVDKEVNIEMEVALEKSETPNFIVKGSDGELLASYQDIKSIYTVDHELNVES